jgi:hypothetical protein
MGFAWVKMAFPLPVSEGLSFIFSKLGRAKMGSLIQFQFSALAEPRSGAAWQRWISFRLEISIMSGGGLGWIFRKLLIRNEIKFANRQYSVFGRCAWRLLSTKKLACAVKDFRGRISGSD